MRIKYLDTHEIDILGDQVVSVSGVAVIRSDPVRFSYSFPIEQYQKLGERRAARFAAMASLRLAVESAENEDDEARAAYYAGLIAHETSIARPAALVAIVAVIVFAAFQALHSCPEPIGYLPNTPPSAHDWSDEQISGWFSTMAGESRENKAALYLLAQASGTNDAICKAAICAGAPKIDATGSVRIDVVAARNYIRSKPWPLVIDHVRLHADDFGESPEYIIRKVSEVLND